MSLRDELLCELYQSHPKRRVIFLDDLSSTDYYEEYIAFNLDILSFCLSKTSLSFSLERNGVKIWLSEGKAEALFRTLILDCAIAGVLNGSECVFLSALCPVCDTMSAGCRILSIFEK